MITVQDISTLNGFISYNCPNCDVINRIRLDQLENYIRVYDVPVKYDDTSKVVELYSPKCIKCEETFKTYIKRGE